MIDVIPTLSRSGNRRNEDLKIIDFSLRRINHYGYVPVYILTDGVISLNRDVYETMVRIGFHEKFVFLDIQEQCFSKLEAYNQHKTIYKKLQKGLYDNQIKKILIESQVTYKK